MIKIQNILIILIIIFLFKARIKKNIIFTLIKKYLIYFKDKNHAKYLYII